MPSYFKDHWELDFKGVKIWHYFRFNYNLRETSSYKPKLSFNLPDFTYFFRFLFLPFSSVEAIYFIAGRKELLTLVLEHSKGKNVLIFIREDSHGIKGNVFFIELLRWFFRRCSPLFFYYDYKLLTSKLSTYGAVDSQIKANIRSVVGDYYFNYFIKYFIKNKKVFFTNCVIPKIEKNQHLHNSCEIQHGVIYDGHPDYCQLPIDFYNTNILCWGDFWRDKLLDLGFPSKKIFSGIDPFSSNEDKDINFKVADVGIFTTVDNDFSFLVSSTIKSLYNMKVCIQLHPRDPYTYTKITGVEFCTGHRPSDFRKVVMHDSTLAYYCVVNKLFFYYLATRNESDEDICVRLKIKYGAMMNIDFSIIRNLNELVV